MMAFGEVISAIASKLDLKKAMKGFAVKDLLLRSFDLSSTARSYEVFIIY